MVSRCNDPGFGIKCTVLSVQQADGICTITVNGVNVTITLQVPGGGFWEYELWLSDSSTSPIETDEVPTSGSTTRWTGLTNSSGVATIQFQNNAASNTWYAWYVFRKANVSGAITAGT